MTDVIKGPQRTCIACRKSKEQSQLIRFVVAPDGSVLVDYRHRLPGRGAYICAEMTCLKAAVERKQFQRNFRGRCRNVSLIDLHQGVCDALRQRIANLLGMAKKSGQFISGSNAVTQVLYQSTKPALILLAEDISASIAEKINQLAGRHQVPIVTMFSKEQLGKLLGKGERSVVAIEMGSLADTILIELQRYLQMAREN